MRTEFTASEVAAPDWLSDLDKPEQINEPALPANPASPQAEQLSDQAGGDLPDWLKELASGKLSEPQPATPQPLNFSDVAVDELPAWLKPSAPSTAESPVTSASW